MSGYLCCWALSLFLTAAIPAPVAIDAAEGQVNKTQAVIEEKNLEMEISEKSFRFMLENIGVSAMLARDLGIFESNVLKQDDGYLITDPWFMLWLDSSDFKGNEHNFEFRYSAGLHSLIPIKTTGKGTAKVTIKSADSEKVSFAVTMRMTPYDAPLDKIAQKIPFIIKTIFLVRLELALQQAEKLANELSDNPEGIMEIIDYEETDLSGAEKKAVKKFLGKKVKS
jgi:hypothetical protein